MKRYLVFLAILINTTAAHSQQALDVCIQNTVPPATYSPEAQREVERNAKACEHEYDIEHPPQYVPMSPKPTKSPNIDVWNKCQVFEKKDHDYYEGKLLKKYVQHINPPDTPEKKAWFAVFEVNGSELTIAIRAGEDLGNVDNFLIIEKNYAMCAEHFHSYSWLYYVVDYPAILPSQAIIIRED